jgi:hypothetical protein
VGGEPVAMARALPGISEPDLERHLLRQSVVALRAAAARHECSDCGRTPLVGEEVHLYARGAVVCALCRVRRRKDPVRSQRVHHAERGQTVRPCSQRAA